MSDFFNFSSVGLPEDEAFRRYAELYGIGTDVIRGEGPFVAEVRAWRLQGLILYDRRLSGVGHARGERTRSDGFDHFVLSLVIEGRVSGSPASGFDEARAGDVFLADTLRATETQAHDVRMLTASVARPILEAALGSTTGLHGLVLHPPANLVLADFMASLARHADTVEPTARPGLSRALIEILGSIAVARAGLVSESRRQAFSKAELVERHIDMNLGDRGLSVETISAATGVSRSSLYRLFDKRGGVGRLILRRRLAALRSALDARDPADDPDLAQRFGFGAAGQMARLFLEHNGQTLAAYRQVVAAAAPGDPDDSRRRWLTWLNEVT